MRRLAIALVACLLLSFEANAQGDPLGTGNTLLPICKNAVRFYEDASGMSQSVMWNTAVCGAYIRGAVEGAATVTAVAAYKLYGKKAETWTSDEYSKRLGVYCMPKEVVPTQAIKVVVRYLEAHPDKLHESSSFLVFWTLKDALPCK